MLGSTEFLFSPQTQKKLEKILLETDKHEVRYLQKSTVPLKLDLTSTKAHHKSQITSVNKYNMGISSTYANVNNNNIAPR